jgi:hypothetical protein
MLIVIPNLFLLTAHHVKHHATICITIICCICIKTVTAFTVPFSWLPSTRNIYFSLPLELLNLNGQTDAESVMEKNHNINK